MFPVFLEYQLSLHKSPMPVQVAGKLHEACTVIPLASSNGKAAETAAAAKSQKKKKSLSKNAEHLLPTKWSIL